MKIKKVVLYGLIFIDCAANFILGGDFKETLSSRAHRMREKQHRVWGWTASFIDGLFFWDYNHCEEQYMIEKAFGSVWKALKHDS